MRTHHNEWCRSALTAFLTVSVSVAVWAQPPGRISDRNSDFDDVNRLLQEGSGSVPGGINGFDPLATERAIDYKLVDQRTLRNLMTESISESEKLYRSLQQDYQRYPEIRPYMTDLLRLRARASRVGQDLQAGVSLERMHPELRQLDSDWRLLSHQMSQSRRLSTSSRDSVQRIDRLQRDLEKLFQMDPQLDRRALMNEISILAGALRNLRQELELDPSGGNRLYELIQDARKLTQEATRVQDMVIDMYPYTSIVPEFHRFESQWTEMIPRLRQLNNRYIDRTVQTIILSDRKLHDLLWLEQSTNRENLRQLANALSRDVDEFFNRVPLKLLLHFKNVGQILAISDDFYGTVQNFKDCIDRNEDDESLQQCYRYLEEYGNVFVREFKTLRSQAGRVVLKEIEDDIVAIRNELRLAGTVTSIDTQAMLPTAAALENLADHLDFDVRQWLYRDPQSFRDQALAASAAFVRRCQQIHHLLETRPTAADLKRQTTDLIEEWRNIYRYLGRCNTEQREHLRMLSQDISQAIYELRAPLEL